MVDGVFNLDKAVAVAEDLVLVESLGDDIAHGLVVVVVFKGVVDVALVFEVVANLSFSSAISLHELGLVEGVKLVDELVGLGVYLVVKAFGGEFVEAGEVELWLTARLLAEFVVDEGEVGDILLVGSVLEFTSLLCGVKDVLNLGEVVDGLEVGLTLGEFIVEEGAFELVVLVLIDYEALVGVAGGDDLGNEGNFVDGGDVFVELIEGEHCAAEHHLRDHDEWYHDVDGDDGVEGGGDYEAEHVAGYCHGE